MSCKNPVLNEDFERICECGDEGRLCGSCYQKQHDYWLELYRLAPLSERDPEAYAEQMRDAGRGHLVKP